ncbi:hypothetical protein [Cellulosimicrobium marinum]|uniref:hypothetical protein n=1 Tax=Cellulosimicrobium marinum TaxID=1638992 RepID=UPI001E5C9AFC|nr:hypothetical protein [Cellulosimicrobium marinum]MCB7135044.1 hypothetical protein [Cellulosimicrobium marinum]
MDAAVVAGLVPEAHAGAHLLALPRSRATARVPLDALARAWFPDAAWTTAPGGGGPARPMAGARFRGVVPDDAVRPGELHLAEGVRAVGPFPLSGPQTQALDLASGAAEAFALVLDAPAPRGAPTAVPDDRDGLARAFAGGLPTGAELQTVAWAVAAARRTGGAVVVDGTTVLTPDPTSGVDLVLFTAQVLTPEEGLGVLRTVVPSAVVTEHHPRHDGPAAFAASGDTPYDGAVRLAMQRVPEVPLALGGLDWREYGPYAYRLSWGPADPYELELERPSGLHVIARGRARVLVARLAAVLHGRVGGTLVDDGGFVVRDLDLDERLTPATAPTTHFWV